MDYLAFGLLAGSLIVIASFVVRDALPHLSAIDRNSRLARLSRAESSAAWERWCADAGLVLAAAGTAVLLVTVAALLVDLSDDAGNIVVGFTVVAAVVISTLVSARLAQRLRMDSERELQSEPALLPSNPARTTELPMVSPEPAAVVVTRQDRVAPRSVPVPSVEPDDVWDDDLPIWTPSMLEPQQTSRVTLAAVPPKREDDVSTAEAPGAGEWPAATDGEEPTPAPFASSGLFSSPLLADIGLPAVDVNDAASDRFRSPLLSDLLDGPTDEGGGEGHDVDAGSDLLIDEAPAPVGSSGRLRDEVDDR